LRSVANVQKRLDAVEALFHARRLREGLREELRHVGDLERLAARACTNRATPRDLAAIRLTLKQIPALKTLLADEQCETLRRLGDTLTLCPALVERIEKALVDDPPATIADGGLIRDGYHAEL